MTESNYRQILTGESMEDRTYVRLDQACPDRVVRVHDEGTPEQHLETLDKTQYFVAQSALSHTVEATHESDEEAAA